MVIYHGRIHKKSQKKNKSKKIKHSKDDILSAFSWEFYWKNKLREMKGIGENQFIVLRQTAPAFGFFNSWKVDYKNFPHSLPAKLLSPRLPNTLWGCIWTPKTYLKHRTSGGTWKTRVHVVNSSRLPMFPLSLWARHALSPPLIQLGLL